MYLTMNRFWVKAGQEIAFETLWQTRDSHLKSVDGFVSFYLLRGEAKGDATLYASHTIWRDQAAFLTWTKSEAFRASHKGAKASGAMYNGPPGLEVFESVQTVIA